MQFYYASIVCKEWASSEIEGQKEVVKMKRADLYWCMHFMVFCKFALVRRPQVYMSHMLHSQNFHLTIEWNSFSILPTSFWYFLLINIWTLCKKEHSIERGLFIWIEKDCFCLSLLYSIDFIVLNVFYDSHRLSNNQ